LAQPLLEDVFSLLVNSIGLAALDATLKPGVAGQWVQAIEGRVQATGKFSKFAVIYTPVQPPPFFWDYNCQRCRFWQEGNSCKVVGGFVARGGWCAIYMPPDGVRPFTWPGRVVQDLPTWTQETPQAIKQWFDTGVPKELGPLAGLLGALGLVLPVVPP